jgi:hypothetical protein
MQPKSKRKPPCVVAAALQPSRRSDILMGFFDDVRRNRDAAITELLKVEAAAGTLARIGPSPPIAACLPLPELPVPSFTLSPVFTP